MAFLWVKDKEVANDVLQEVFEKAWLRRNDLEGMENPKGWIYRTLRNESMQYFRNLKKTEEVAGLELEYEADDETDSYDERLKLVFRFLDKLPEKQKEVFQLREVEGLTYEEIAHYLDISLDQVKVNLDRARKSLREYLITKK